MGFNSNRFDPIIPMSRINLSIILYTSSANKAHAMIAIKFRILLIEGQRSRLSIDTPTQCIADFFFLSSEMMGIHRKERLLGLHIMYPFQTLYISGWLHYTQPLCTSIRDPGLLLSLISASMFYEIVEYCIYGFHVDRNHYIYE